MRMSTQTVEPNSDALEPQHSRQRRRSRRMTIGAFAVVAAIGLAAVGSSILGPFGGGNSTTPAHEAITRAQTGTGADIESSRELRDGRVVKLIPGRVTTHELALAVAFSVPPAWYGYQRLDGFEIGKRLSTSAIGVDFASGGISVRGFDYPLARALRQLETAAGIRVHDVSPVRIGGYSGREYGLVLRRPLFRDVLGVPPDLQPGERLILLGVGSKTLLIRRGFDTDQERREIERVVMSFRFPR